MRDRRPTTAHRLIRLALAASIACATPAEADLDISPLLARSRPEPVSAAPPAPPASEPAPEAGSLDPEELYQRGLSHDGVDDPAELAEAARWYRLAAEQGHVDAQINLGVMLSQGDGVEKDEAAAVRWFTAASEAGNPRGQYSLALMYYQGIGVERSLSDAAFWYRRAAIGGYPSAMNNLGIMYGLGEGVERDDATAYAWFALSALAGDPNGVKNRDLTSDELSPADLERGQQTFFELREEIEDQ